MDEHLIKLFRRKFYYSMLIGYFVYFVGTYPREQDALKHILQIACFFYACIQLMDNVVTYKELLVLYAIVVLPIHFSQYLPSADPITSNPKYMIQELQDGYFVFKEIMQIYATLIFLEICVRLWESRRRQFRNL